MKKLSRLAVMLALVLALTACSGGVDVPLGEYSVLFGRPGPLYLPDLLRPHGAGSL